MTTLFGFPNLKGSVELIRFSFAIKLCFVVYLFKFKDDKLYIYIFVLFSYIYIVYTRTQWEVFLDLSI